MKPTKESTDKSIPQRHFMAAVSAIANNGNIQQGNITFRSEKLDGESLSAAVNAFLQKCGFK